MYFLCVISKILQMREKEDKASQDLIKKILEEEQEQELQQEKADEQLARKLSDDFKQTQVFSLVSNQTPPFSVFKIIDIAYTDLQSVILKFGTLA